MEHPPISIHAPQYSKKRFFAGSSNGVSSSFMDPDVIEIPPPTTWIPKPLKRKSIVGHEVIVVDDEDSEDIMIIGEKVAPTNKGKSSMPNFIGAHGVGANNLIPSSQPNDFVEGYLSSHVSVIDDDLTGVDLSDTFYDDEYAMWQAQFDSIDTPSGIEATVPWWPASAGDEKHTVPASSSSLLGTQSYSNFGVSTVDQFQSWSLIEPLQAKSVSEAIGWKLGSPSIEHQNNIGFYMQTSGMTPPIPQWPLAPGYNKKNQATSSNLQKLPSPGMIYSSGLQNTAQGHSIPFVGPLTAASLPSPFLSGYSPFVDPSIRLDDSITAGISPPSTDERGGMSENHILKKLELFQRFDYVEDHSDHHYHNHRSYNQPNSWKKKIFAEWDMLKKDLPDTIFVRIYEARLDLLRAVIVGAEGTPYHDGLFFFDVYFTPSYPDAPPRVKYHAHGLRLNPNLYNCGKVCLSLLGTWTGHGNENWRPGKSNMLQVLVSIQGLILNAEPYYNEPGFVNCKNAARSKDYNENAFLLSLKTMLYTMRNPPKHFEDLVYGHFYNHAHDILSACRAYLDGIQVGNFIKGKTPSVDQETPPQTCSQRLKMSLPVYIKSLVEAFTKIGVKDCERFGAPVDNGANQSKGRGSRHRYKSRY